MSKISDEETRARSEQKAHERAQAELAAQNPRKLVVDTAAIQRRNEISAQLLSHYSRLVDLYLPEEALKRPPDGG